MGFRRLGFSDNYHEADEVSLTCAYLSAMAIGWCWTALYRYSFQSESKGMLWNFTDGDEIQSVSTKISRSLTDVDRDRERVDCYTPILSPDVMEYSHVKNQKQDFFLFLFFLFGIAVCFFAVGWILLFFSYKPNVSQKKDNQITRKKSTSFSLGYNFHRFNYVFLQIMIITFYYIMFHYSNKQLPYFVLLLY